MSIRVHFWLLVFSLAAAGLAAGETVRVVRVSDGDTIVVEGGVKIRLLGIDAPELHHPCKPVQCYAKEARRFVAGRVQGQLVNLTFEETGPDSFDRTLAWVWYGPEFKTLLNAEIVEEGYAFSFRKYPTSRLEELNRLEAEARAEQRGMWAPDACADKIIFYVTPDGCCYHRRSCRIIANSKKLTALTRTEAESRGYRSCKACDP